MQLSLRRNGCSRATPDTPILYSTRHRMKAALYQPEVAYSQLGFSRMNLLLALCYPRRSPETLRFAWLRNAMSTFSCLSSACRGRLVHRSITLTTKSRRTSSVLFCKDSKDVEDAVARYSGASEISNQWRLRRLICPECSKSAHPCSSSQVRCASRRGNE